MIIATVGCSGSGKSSARFFFESKGFISFEASDYSKKIRNNNIPAFDFFSVSQNRTRVIEEISEEIDQIKSDRIIISGLRIFEEIDFLRKRFNEVIIIGIFAPESILYERVVARKGRDKFPDIKTFYFKRLVEDYALGLASIFFKYCDYIVDNVSSEQQFHSQLESILDKINKNNETDSKR
ncbi:hypothetical protein KJ784_04430 [Patescibacteria group bacterium]|nr:hypothetical protein [Patescibacteria group bacterium]